MATESVASWEYVWQRRLSYTQHAYRFFRGFEKLIVIHSISPFGPGLRVLDIGCGGGHVCILLEKLFGVSACGIDSSRTSINIATGLARQWSASAQFTLGLATSIPYGDGLFDYTLNFGVLEHSKQPLDDLKENIRVLRPGGRAWFVVPNLLSIGPLDRLVKQLIGRWPYGFQREMSDMALKRLLAAAGFVRIETFARTRNWKGQPIRLGRRYGWYLYASAIKPES